MEDTNAQAVLYLAAYLEVRAKLRHADHRAKSCEGRLPALERECAELRLAVQQAGHRLDLDEPS